MSRDLSFCFAARLRAALLVGFQLIFVLGFGQTAPNTPTTTPPQPGLVVTLTAGMDASAKPPAKAGDKGPVMVWAPQWAPVGGYGAPATWATSLTPPTSSIASGTTGAHYTAGPKLVLVWIPLWVKPVPDPSAGVVVNPPVISQYPSTARPNAITGQASTAIPKQPETGKIWVFEAFSGSPTGWISLWVPFSSISQGTTAAGNSYYSLHIEATSVSAASVASAIFSRLNISPYFGEAMPTSSVTYKGDIPIGTAANVDDSDPLFDVETFFKTVLSINVAPNSDDLVPPFVHPKDGKPDPSFGLLVHALKHWFVSSLASASASSGSTSPITITPAAGSSVTIVSTGISATSTGTGGTGTATGSGGTGTGGTATGGSGTGGSGTGGTGTGGAGTGAAGTGTAGTGTTTTGGTGGTGTGGTGTGGAGTGGNGTGGAGAGGASTATATGGAGTSTITATTGTAAASTPAPEYIRLTRVDDRSGMYNLTPGDTKTSLPDNGQGPARYTLIAANTSPARLIEALSFMGAHHNTLGRFTQNGRLTGSPYAGGTVATAYPLYGTIDDIADQLATTITGALRSGPTVTAWPMTFVRADFPNPSTAGQFVPTPSPDTTDSFMTTAATTLQKIDTTNSLQVLPMGTRLILTGPQKTVDQARRFLAQWLDIPYSTVRLDFYTFQGVARTSRPGSDVKTLTEMQTLKEGADLARMLQGLLYDQLLTEVRMTPSIKFKWGDVAKKELHVNDTVSLLNLAGFDTHPNRALSLSEALVFLLFLDYDERDRLIGRTITRAYQRFLNALPPEDRRSLADNSDTMLKTSRLGALVKEFVTHMREAMPAVPSAIAKTDDQKAAPTTQSQLANDFGRFYAALGGGVSPQLAQSAKDLESSSKQSNSLVAAVLPSFQLNFSDSKGKGDSGYVWGPDDENRISRARRLLVEFLKYWLLALNLEDLRAGFFYVDGSLQSTYQGQSSEAVRELLGHIVDGATGPAFTAADLDYALMYEDIPARLTQVSSAGDALIKGTAQALADDLDQLCMSPFVQWAKGLHDKGRDTFGLGMVSTTTITATAGQVATIATGAQTALPYHAPTTLSQVETAGTSVATAAGGAIGILEAKTWPGLLLLGTALGAPAVAYNDLTSSISLGVRPWVFKGAGSARLQLNFNVAVTPSTTNNPSVNQMSFVTNQNITTDVAVDALDLFELASTNLQTSGPGEYKWSVPVLKDLPILGGMFRGDTKNETKTFDTIVFVRVSILPRSLDFAGSFFR